MSLEDLSSVQRELLIHPRRGELVLQMISLCRRLGRSDLARDWLEKALLSSIQWDALPRAPSRRRRLHHDGRAVWFMSSVDELLFYWPPQRSPMPALFATPRPVIVDFLSHLIMSDPKMLLDEANELSVDCLVPVDCELVSAEDLRRLERFGPSPSQSALIDPQTARESRVLPLSRDESGLRVLSAEPLDPGELRALSLALRQPVRLFIVDSGRFYQLFETFYG